MRFLFKWIMRLIWLLVLAGLLLWLFGPREAVVTDVSFDPALINGDADAYFARREAPFDDITEGVQKRVIWQGDPGQKAPVSVLYIHGFSATSEEIRPVPDQVADALGANLVFTRLQGHGRSGKAMAQATVRGWMEDVAEALAVARIAGEEVIVISTSTGGTLSAVVALDPELRKDIKGMIFVSPNFGVNHSAAGMLTWPAARWWAPLVVGAEIGFEPKNQGQAMYWTTSYPTVATLPMAALVKHTVSQDFGQATIPALFWFSDADQVVVAEQTHRIAGQWGAPVRKVILEQQKGDDPYGHVMTGDIVTPARTGQAVKDFLGWIDTL